jgi:hypothetical protein
MLSFTEPHSKILEKGKKIKIENDSGTIGIAVPVVGFNESLSHYLIIIIL